MLNLINQYSSISSPTTTTPLLHDSNEFPSLPNMHQRQQARWKKIIEETTKRLFKSLQQKIKTIEQTISSVETLINDDTISSSSLSDSDEDIQIVNAKNKKQPTTTTKPKNDRVGKPGGGVLGAVKPHLECREMMNRTIHKNEIVAVQIEMQLYKSMLISSIYVPPTAKIGDRNATLYEIGLANTDARGKQLQELLNESLIEYVDDDSTTFEKE
ncbi:unnamed protein product [Rotaria socialis]|uniref:Uncharacterized protein n=1 Tax=Rotaria socialis TaxID=392032 RepID=A0A821WT79_9BILA|nr:unnamed protein product [Rotaria socialis]